MPKFFSYDSKISQFLSRLWDVALLNFLWILGCLPIATIGVSSIAAYSVALKIADESETAIIAPFFRAYKENFKQGLILAPAFILLCGAVVLDFLLFEVIEGNPIYILIIGIISAILVMVHFFYVFPLAARYNNNLFWHLTNSRKIYIRFFGRSLFCTLLVALEVWLFFANSWLLLFIGVFIGPALIMITISTFALKIFLEIEAEGGVRNAGKATDFDDESEIPGNIEKSDETGKSYDSVETCNDNNVSRSD